MSFVGPGMTVLTTGNVFKAATQLMIDQSIKKKTGKNSLAFVSEKINKNSQNYKKNKFNEDLRKLVEQRIMITRKKLDDQNLKKLVKKRINVTKSILNLTNTTQ
tara:strand:- start:1266 stop:1577 length:312 start_codon:yes stop_codon:yes gene_type:complete